MKRTERGTRRVFSILLTLLMILTLVPTTVFAAGSTIKTNKDTYEVGEAIMVTASTDVEGAWVSIIKEADADNATSYYWYYVDGSDSDSGKSWKDGETYNIYDAVCSNREGYSTAWQLKPGNYRIVMLKGNYELITEKKITLTASTATETSIRAEKDVFTEGDPIRLQVDGAGDQAWVGVYAGNRQDTDDFSGDYGMYWFYAPNHNGAMLDVLSMADSTSAGGAFTPGKYTAVLFTASSAVDKVVHFSVEPSEVPIVPLATDKEVYAWGEPIMVTTNYNAPGAWVGLYKKGETYDPNAGGVKSIFWYYLADTAVTVTNPMNILKARDENDRGGEYIAGEYTVVLFAGDNYNVYSTVDITVTREESGRTVVPPTCTEEGYTLVTYTDGTSEKIDIVPALGHEWGDWTYNAADKTHTHVCTHDSAHSETADCTFDEGAVIKEATETENGIKRFTCTVCGGTYDEEISKKEVDRTEVIKPATCEEEGILRTWYTDGTYIDTAIPKLGHAYGEWVYNEETHQHTKTCANDPSHVITENCTFTATTENGVVTHTCTVCGGSYTSVLLATDKEVYKIGEPIMVTTDYSAEGAWVGLYKKGDIYGEGAGSVKSIFWYYLSEQPNPTNILKTRNENFRDADYGAGEFVVILFADGGYDAIAQVEITVETVDVSDTVFTLTVNGQVCQDNEEITLPAGTEKIVYSVTAKGETGTSWIGRYNKRFGKNYDFGSTPSDDWYYVGEYNGKELVIDKPEAGAYTLVLFGDGAYGNVLQVVYIVVEEEVASEEIIKEPTCTDYGTKKVTYPNGKEDFIPIPPLGHEWGDWTYNAADKTHSRICARCSQVDTLPCTFDEGTVIREATETETGIMRYTCTVCGGTYDEVIPNPVPEHVVLRLYGDTRYQTALLQAEVLKLVLGVEKFDAIIVATGTNYADALSGAYLGYVKKAPILLVRGDVVEDVKAYIQANLTDGGTVYLLGGKAVVPEAVTIGLENAVVKRLEGATRYETNIAILKEAGVTNQDILIADGTNFADSLSASAAMRPILLVRRALNDEQRAYLKTLPGNDYYLIGGEGVLPPALESEIRNDYGKVTRLGGKDRYETSVKVAKAFFPETTGAVVAYAMNYPDGLCGGTLAAYLGGPLLLARDGRTAAIVEYTTGAAITDGIVLGGPGLVSDESVRSIFGMGETEQIVVLH